MFKLITSYSVHSSPFWVHSNIRPRDRIVIKAKAEADIVVMVVVWIAHGRGRRRAISRSKRRKVIATKKNFIENGRRAELVGSNPHS